MTSYKCRKKLVQILENKKKKKKKKKKKTAESIVEETKTHPTGTYTRGVL